MRWCMLLSAFLHILAQLAVNLILTPAVGPQPTQDNPSILGVFSDTDQADESLRAQVSSTDPWAQLPEPAERMPPNTPDEDHHRDPSSDRAPRQPGSAQTWLSDRVPLLSGNDLDKYAKLPPSEHVRSSRPLSGLDTVISLNTKDIRYLSYFAHIEHKIEQVWGYPTEAMTGRMQGQLLLLFVLQRSAQVKKVELLRSFGSKVLDKEAWDAVVNAVPFAPFPPQIP